MLACFGFARASQGAPTIMGQNPAFRPVPNSRPPTRFCAGQGGPTEEIRPGDVIWFPPGEKHWHGATPTTAMTHVAVQEQLDGKAVDWMEKVSEEQYRG